MKFKSIFIISILLVFSYVYVGGPVNGDASILNKSTDNPVINIGFEWVNGSSQSENKILIKDISIKNIDCKGLWFGYAKENDKLYPYIATEYNIYRLDKDTAGMKSLRISINYTSKKETKNIKRTIFSKELVLGKTEPNEKDIYSLFVINHFVKNNNVKCKTPDGLEREACYRVRGLAAGYAAKQEKLLTEYSRLFNINVGYNIPKIILTGEEWYKIPVKKEEKKKSSGGGLFGGNLDEMIFGEEENSKPEFKEFTSYSVDVLLDEPSISGKELVAFNTAYSMRTDILEGEIIYAATNGQRKVITASIVFSQLKKNNAELGTDNRALKINASKIQELDKCTYLQPNDKNVISEYIKNNPECYVMIPEKPVIFFHKNEPAYGMYAWFKVNPQTGKMIGVLPDGSCGGSDDHAASIRETLKKAAIDKASETAKEEIMKKTGKEGGAHMFFGTIAGMYVASAGIIDGIGKTIENPELANLSEKEWEKFLINNSLNFCRKFLEDNSDVYGYSASAGFWMGATALIGQFNNPEASKDFMKGAWNHMVDKAKKDIEEAVKKKAGEIVGSAKKEARKNAEKYIWDKVEKYTDRADDVKKFANTAEKVYDFTSNIEDNDMYKELKPDVEAIIKNNIY